MPQPPAKKSNTRLVVLSVIALLVIAGGVLGLVLYNNHVTTINNNNSTATAQTQAQQATGTANAYASAMSRGSLHAVPMNDTPTGSPWLNPAGTVTMG